jgi:calcineurin-like phosphoesterase family protein
MSKDFFTSDNHFGHLNILKKFCPDTRQGVDADDMDRIMIQRWQEQVAPEDTVYMLGDVFFHRDVRKAIAIMRQLTGRKVLTYGNHDQLIRNNIELQRMFADIAETREININRTHVVVHHFPIYEWNKMHRGSYHVYGHIHSPYGLIEHPHIPGRCMDVGIDSRPGKDMTLWSWEEIDRNLSQRAIRGHHEKEL